MIRTYFTCLFLLIIPALTSFSSVTLKKGTNSSSEGMSGKLFSDTIMTGEHRDHFQFIISAHTGMSHNHPSFVFWIEDMDGNYLTTLYVTGYVASGVFRYADAGTGKWKDVKGESVRPASLPYWAHKRGIVSRDSLYIPVPENPVPDAYSGATPPGNFVLLAETGISLPEKFRVLFEVNQTWDWNEYWTNNKFPGDADYQSSCQPSLIYAVTINTQDEIEKYFLNPIGHGHYSGDNGRLYTDLSTITTALHIYVKTLIEVKFKIP
jgi:hypothetical protein